MILISEKVSSQRKCFEYFLSYKDVDKIKLLCIMFPIMSGSVKCFDKTK